MLLFSAFTGEIFLFIQKYLTLEKILAARWQGGNYSSRIWKNTEKLSDVIKETITAGVPRSLSFPKMSKAVELKMGAGVSNAERLVRTEMNFLQNQAAGFDEYEFIAVLDHRTTPRQCIRVAALQYLRYSAKKRVRELRVTVAVKILKSPQIWIMKNGKSPWKVVK